MRHKVLARWNAARIRPLFRMVVRFRKPALIAADVSSSIVQI
jgi:hypothetical protein